MGKKLQEFSPAAPEYTRMFFVVVVALFLCVCFFVLFFLRGGGGDGIYDLLCSIQTAGPKHVVSTATKAQGHVYTHVHTHARKLERTHTKKHTQPRESHALRRVRAK